MTESINELNPDLFGPGDDGDRSTDPAAARRKAMDLLARREYGKQELVARLTAKGFDEGVAAEAILELVREGLQDDARFAESFVRAKAGRGAGPVRIRQALLDKGLADGVVDRALAGPDIDWNAAARRVRSRKFGSPVPSDFKDKARQMRFLQYRGFDHDQIRAALHESD